LIEEFANYEQRRFFMKKVALLGCTLGLTAALSWADNPPPPNTGAGGAPAQPCKQIEQACSSAGFVKGEAKEGKGLFKDCVQPILHGQSVNGVTVDPSIVAACKQRMHRRHMHKQGGQGQPGGQGGQGQPTGQGGQASPNAGSKEGGESSEQ
jgi:hypothetical protein